MAVFTSSTKDIPVAAALPRHVAIIMDGNGRWAKKRFLPRFAGHRRGVEMVRESVKYCLKRGIRYLTLKQPEFAQKAARMDGPFAFLW